VDCLDFLRQPGTRLVTWPGSSRITTTPEHSTVPPVPRNIGRNAEQIPRPPRHPSGPNSQLHRGSAADIQVNLKTAVVLDQVDQRIRPVPRPQVRGDGGRVPQSPATTSRTRAPRTGCRFSCRPPPIAGSTHRVARPARPEYRVLSSSPVRSTGSAASGAPRDSPRQLSIMVRGSGSPRVMVAGLWGSMHEVLSVTRTRIPLAAAEHLPAGIAIRCHQRMTEFLRAGRSQLSVQTAGAFPVRVPNAFPA